MTREIELNAELRNKLQASIIVLTKLVEGKQVPRKLLLIAKKDLKKVVDLLDKLK